MRIGNVLRCSLMLVCASLCSPEFSSAQSLAAKIEDHHRMGRSETISDNERRPGTIQPRPSNSLLRTVSLLTLPPQIQPGT